MSPYYAVWHCTWECLSVPFAWLWLWQSRKKRGRCRRIYICIHTHRQEGTTKTGQKA